MSVSRDARSGDSPDTLSARAGTFTLESSRLISLTSRVFSATSCINRSRWDDAWDRLSIRACTSGDGPCLHPAATRIAMGSHAPRTRRRQLRGIFLNLLPGLACRRPHGCLTRTNAGLGKCSTCWLGTNDGVLRALCWAGAALALLLVAGVAQAPVLLLLWIGYLSLTVAGQNFLWFQWDGLLLETGLLAVLFAPIQLRPSLRCERAPSTVMRWLVWGLLFRLMFLSGVTKLASGDPTWLHFTALDYHFWTQPLPTWPAWYAQWLPEWMHQGMTIAIIGIELLVPWFILVPERWGGPRARAARRAACGLLVLGQLAIALTGNYGFFNLLAIVLCVSLLDDAALRRGAPPPPSGRGAGGDAPDGPPPGVKTKPER